MASHDPFSIREGIRYVPDTFEYADLPQRVRIGIFTELLLLLRQNADVPIMEIAARELYRITCRRTREYFNTDSERYSAVFTFENRVIPILRKATWVEFLDVLDEWFPIVEELTRELAEEYGNTQLKKLLLDCEAQVNRLFLEEGIGWQLREDRIERRQAAVLESRIQETGRLLNDPQYKSADQLWSKAVDAINRRPEPDIENCIKDAVGAVESLAHIVTGNTKGDLGALIKELASKGKIPKPLDESLTKMYAYRGNQPGVSHGSAEPLTADVADAEYVLNWAAATIIYLSKKSDA